MPLHLEFDPENERTFGPCECCGNMTRRVWGNINEGEATVGVYYVEWTPGHDDNPAIIDLIVGPWGDATTAQDRKAVCLHFRQFETGPSFMVADATDRPVGKSNLVGEALRREDVIDRPIAQKIFGMCDTIWLDDPRIADLRA